MIKPFLVNKDVRHARIFLNFQVKNGSFIAIVIILLSRQTTQILAKPDLLRLRTVGTASSIWLGALWYQVFSLVSRRCLPSEEEPPAMHFPAISKHSALPLNI